MKTVAVMKIGSTSTTLLVAADLGHVLVRQQSIVNLYAAQGPALLNAVLEDYTARADAAGCSIRLAAGGEGLRHHQELAGRIKDYHWPYWSVSGQLEGQLTWFAVKASHPDMEWLWDIGGGSTEVCSSQESYSIPVGAAHYGVANWPKVSVQALPWWSEAPPMPCIKCCKASA
jgi:hypothetical protein